MRVLVYTTSAHLRQVCHAFYFLLGSANGHSCHGTIGAMGQRCHTPRSSRINGIGVNTMRHARTISDWDPSAKDWHSYIPIVMFIELLRSDRDRGACWLLRRNISTWSRLCIAMRGTASSRHKRMWCPLIRAVISMSREHREFVKILKIDAFCNANFRTTTRFPVHTSPPCGNAVFPSGMAGFLPLPGSIETEPMDDGGSLFCARGNGWAPNLCSYLHWNSVLWV